MGWTYLQNIFNEVGGSFEEKAKLNLVLDKRINDLNEEIKYLNRIKEIVINNEFKGLYDKLVKEVGHYPPLKIKGMDD